MPHSFPSDDIGRAIHKRANRSGRMCRSMSLKSALAGAAALLLLPESGTFAADMTAVVHEADDVRAEAHTDCDASAYVLVTLTMKGAAERFAAPSKFADKVAPSLPAILDGAAAWLEGEGSDLCDQPVQTETITVVGLVNALPIYVTGASRSAAWAPGSAVAEARHLAAFAEAQPQPAPAACTVFDEAIGANIDKLRTRIFTIRAAHTTGQWSHMQALTKLVPLHQEIMSHVGDWGLAWQCPGVFELAGVAILADEERSVLLKWNEQKIRDRVAQDGSSEQRTATMTEVYRSPALPPVSSLAEWIDRSRDTPRVRYGGYLTPEAQVAEDVFSDTAN